VEFPAAGAPPAAATAGEEGAGISDAIQDAEATGRRRHNTIVGLFRNAIRRPEGEAPGSITPAADATALPLTTASMTSSAQDKATAEAAAAGGVTGKPRSLRFTFNSNTTSSKPPDEIVTEVVAQAKKQGLQAQSPARYVIEVIAPLQGPAAPGREQVKIEIEICKLPRLKNLHGLRFKRLSGTSADYKDVCEKLLHSLSL